MTGHADNRDGDFVAFAEQRNGVLIKPRSVVDPEDTLTPEEARQLRRVLKQVRAGKTRPWSQIKREMGL